LKQVTDVFSYLYVFTLLVAVGAFASLFVTAASDYAALIRYNPAAVSYDKSLRYGDTIERRILDIDPSFHAFSEGTGALGVGLGMGVQFVTLAMVHLVVGLVCALALQSGSMTDVTAAAIDPVTHKPTLFLYALAVGGFYYAALIIYKVVFFNTMLKRDLVQGVVAPRKRAVAAFDAFVYDQMYNGKDALVFYGRLRTALTDNGASMAAYVRARADAAPATEVAKMVFTFNVFNYVYGTYNTTDDFTSSQVFAKFWPDGRAMPLSPHIAVLTLRASAPNILHIFDQADATSNAWSEGMRNLEEVRNLSKAATDQANSLLAKAFSDMNWTSARGPPSEIFRAFQSYTGGRTLFTGFVAAPVWLAMIVGAAVLLVWAWRLLKGGAPIRTGAD
jgi:hypothetical protein